MFRHALLMIALIGFVHADRVKDYHVWHEKCLESDDAKTIDHYISLYQKRVDADGKDQLAKVYLGSAYTLRSAESFWGPKKLEYLKKGGALMDQADATSPNDPRVRFIRGVNGYKVPKRFKRRGVAVMDFTALLPMAEKGGHNLTLRERQAMLFYAWKTFDEEGHAAMAQRARKSCHKLDPKSWYGGETAPSN